MSEELPQGYVTALVCTQCGELPTDCGCAEGCHLETGLQPHPRRVHCCLCETPTHEFIRWVVGDSYSFGPLCMECRNQKTNGWQSTGLDGTSVLPWIRGEED